MLSALCAQGPGIPFAATASYEAISAALWTQGKTVAVSVLENMSEDLGCEPKAARIPLCYALTQTLVFCLRLLLLCGDSGCHSQAETVDPAKVKCMVNTGAHA